MKVRSTKLRIVSVVGALCLGMPVAAQSGSAVPKWGATLADVQSLLGNRFAFTLSQPETWDGLSKQATGPVAFMKVDFVADLYFSPLLSKLAAIRLTPNDPSLCGALRTEIGASFGPAIEAKRTFNIYSEQHLSAADNTLLTIFDVDETDPQKRKCNLLLRPASTPIG